MKKILNMEINKITENDNQVMFVSWKRINFHEEFFGTNLDIDYNF